MPVFETLGPPWPCKDFEASQKPGPQTQTKMISMTMVIMVMHDTSGNIIINNNTEKKKRQEQP